MSPKVIFHKIETDPAGNTSTLYKTGSQEEHNDPDFMEMFNELIPSQKIAVLRPRRVFAPPTDIYENSSNITVKLEIAGIAPELVTIEWVGYDLIIRGVRKENSAKKATHYHQVEIHYGTFERIIRLSRKINPKGAKATYNNGFLIITIPKAPNARTRVIPIEER